MINRESVPYHPKKWCRLHGHLWLNGILTVLMLSVLLLSPLTMMPVHALAVPTLIAPDEGVTITGDDAPPLAIPEFNWTAVGGATSYRIQVATDIAFTTRVVDIVTPNTHYTPINAAVFPDGTWFWRVRVESPAPAGDYTAGRSFIKQWATPENKPLLSFPAESAIVDFYDSPVFSWSAVTGASKYKLQIYSSPGGWTSLATPQITTLVTTYQPLAKLANGTYYWRVVPVDGGGHDGTPSNERPFTAGYNPIHSLIEPADQANPTFTPTFSWTAVRGAQTYTLQYSTDPSFMSATTAITTHNTAYTPTVTLPNDVNYYWRVKVTSGSSITDWTSSRSFIKKWYLKPVLLTPTNNYQHVRFPVYSWTPVPGAAYYKVEIANNPNFNPLYTSGNTANTFYTPAAYKGDLLTFYWRVTPYDGSGKAGVPSNTSSYVSSQNELAPQQVYPSYYYLPNSYGVETNPFEDRTVSQPIFMWHRVYKPIGNPDVGGVYSDAYRLQVSTDPTFSSVTWTVDTENTVATPSADHPFLPAINTDYYWRVRPLIQGSEAGDWSQIWRARFDPSLEVTSKTSPILITPTNGFESSDTTPLLQWFPISGASAYDVQIASDSDFFTIVNQATSSYPSYAPLQSLAQRNLGDTTFGVYYWRIRKSPSGAWSETRRFQISAPSEWQYIRTSGAPANRLQIGSDSASDIVDSDYDVTNLNVAQSKDYWFIGFQVPTSPSKDVTYVLYLDLDHQDGSGATFDALGYSFNTVSAYRPEYALYVMQHLNAFSASSVDLFHWNGSGWDTVNVLGSIGGTVYSESGYVELKVPNTAIGYQDTTGSYAFSLLSLPVGNSGTPKDSVPSDPNVPGTAPISHFANVTERMNLVAPANDAGIDPAPTTYPSILPFFWDYTVHAPWSGVIMKAYLDPQLTTEAGTYTLTSNAAFYAQVAHAWGTDFQGDNTYYWRIQPRYRDSTGTYSGVWSQPWRFERKGFVVQNLKTSVTFATPTFSWDISEGAEDYDLQVSTDPNFGAIAINQNTTQNSFTPTASLAPATYYWRVRVNRNGSVSNNWSSPQMFTLTLPIPTNLNNSPASPNRAPTLCWTPLIKDDPSSGDPVFAAWKYSVQISKDPLFTPNVWETVTTEQTCYTPIKAYDDGTYYWRVAALDGEAHVGNYSSYVQFTKQYPRPNLISPTAESSSSSTPTFVWTPVNGAAKYKLEVSIVDTFGTIYETVTTSNTRYTPTKTYPTGTYYWHVAMVDDAGKLGPYQGATAIIDPNAPGTFNKISPSNGNNTQLANVTLSWTASANATFYEYCFSTSNPCVNWTSTGTTTSVDKTGLLPDTTYYWNVRAKNLTGSTTYSDGTTTDFLFNTAPIGVATLSSLSPSQKYADSLDFILTVNGGSFWSGHVVFWNGVPLVTTWVSPTQLTAVVPGSSVAHVDAVDVTVMTPSLEESNKLTLPVFTFADVPPTHNFWRYIEGFYAEGITTGCSVNPMNYCPDNPVTRAAMAVFLLRAKNGIDYQPPAATGIFTDLPVAGKEWMQPWVEEFYREGITTGCSADPLQYCPENSVTRASMAVFLLRAKYGANYQPPAATGIFADLPVTGKEWMEPWVEQFYREGITTGCGVDPLRYCPEDPVKRQAMAVFIDRAFGIPQLP